MAGGFGFKSVETTAYEVDSTLRGHLSQQMAVYSYAKTNVIAGDYIELATAEGLVPRSYTQADLTALRATGCDHTFVDVQTGVGKYVQWLAK